MLRITLNLCLLLALCLSCSNNLLADGKDQNKELLYAVQSMDAAKTKELLAKGADANYMDGGRPLLAWAAQTGQNEIVEALLAAKANPNTFDGIGQTALMRAVDMQQIKNVNSLLKAKADPNLKTKDGKSILTMAVESGKPEIVKALIDAGVDVKAVSPDGDSPALSAAQAGSDSSLQIIKLLGDAKAELNASNAAYTPLYYAVQQGNKDLVQALLDAGADPNGKTQDGHAPIFEAFSNLDILQALLKAKADPNLKNNSGETALLAAVEEGTKDAVEKLLKAGADVNFKTDSGNTALQLANNYSKSDVAELLKASGAKE